MKPIRLLSLLAALLAPGLSRAQPAPGGPPMDPSAAAREAMQSDSARQYDEMREAELRRAAIREEKPRSLDPKRIINQSNNFLKEREPEMTAEEFALYQKVLTSLAANPDFALKLLEAMMSDKEVPSPAFEFILGNVYYNAGQTDKAEQRYRNAVNRFPSFIRAWTNLGVLYYMADRYAEAAPCFSKALALGDRDPGTYGLLGYCLERAGNTVAAEMSYLQALAGNPENTDWMEGLLRIYIQGEQYGRAESLAKNLVRLKPAKAEFWLARANIMLAQRRKLEAMVVLEACVGAGIAGPDEFNLLGDLYAEHGLSVEAAGIYQKLLAGSADMGERKLLHFAQVLNSVGRLAEAEGVLARLPANLTPAGRLQTLQTRADLLAARKQWSEARKVLNELLQLSPLNGRALLSLGSGYAAEEDFLHATFAFEAAYRIPDACYRASLELANLELKGRHYDKCVEYLQKALSLEKTDAVEDDLARIKTLAAGSKPPNP